MTVEQERSATDGQPLRRKRLGRGLADLWMNDERPIYDVVIVGTGYGGSVAASRLAGLQHRDGKRISVCVLERGNEYLPGEFPARLDQLAGHLRMTEQNSGKIHGNHEGLFDLRLGDDVAALLANGLGGGSLINAGVMLEPDGADDRLPPQIRHLIGELRGAYFDQAREAVGAPTQNTIERHPDVADHPLPKSRALATLVRPLKAVPVPLSISMDGGANGAKVALEQCKLCGDCMTGCNVGAKNSHDCDQLERAVHGGAEIFTGATVLSIRRSLARSSDRGEVELGPEVPKHWVLRIVHTDGRLQAREADVLRIRAHHVVLAAGSLGSTEILLRSRSDELVFSSRLGKGFSCNGDNLAAVHRMPERVDCCADEDVPLVARGVGPTITHSARVGSGGRDFLLQEFAVPGALKQLFDEVVTTADTLNRLPDGDDSTHGNPGPGLDPLAVNPEFMGKTLLVGVIGHDDAAGTLGLSRPVRPRDRPSQQGGVRIHWPQARHADELKRRMDQLRELVRKLPNAADARLVPNPMWQLLPEDLADLVSQPYGPVLTVHPLGGCGIGADCSNGVVDSEGRVFDAGAATVDYWQGTLVVLDGAAVPGSLGVNPALTITAMALRAIDRLVQDWKFVPAESKPLSARARRRLEIPDLQQPRYGQHKATMIEVIERLSGKVSLGPEAKPHRVELTLAYAPVEVRELMSTLERKIKVQSGHRLSRLRIFDEAEWTSHSLNCASDEERQPFALLEADLGGSLRLLHREASTACARKRRGLRAWLLNRGLRDSWQHCAEARKARAESDERARLRGALRLRRPEPSVARAEQAPKRPSKGLIERACAFVRLASRAGEVRLFEYELEVVRVLAVKDAASRHLIDIVPGSGIGGVKRLTYSRCGNPWRQLTELSLTGMPGLAAGDSATLKLDVRFLANQGMPLLRITQQENHARALADLFSFGLYMARLLASVHLWTFRKPDRPADREPQRLPGPIEGIDSPVVTELVVDRYPQTDEPVKIRLTCYRPRQGARADSPPLVMIHGYSVSGNTFTHPSLKPSAAEYFCKTQRREVWVVDLRTSTGLPGAKHPWSMEQVALIDIPAALLHISDASKQRVDVLAHCIGCVMLSMALLTDATDVRSGAVELGVEAWLTSEQLGTLTAFNGAARRSGLPHPCIRSIVLSQKGPVLRYTDSNIFRAFAFQSVRRWLLADDYQFRAPREATVSDELLDRFLSSLPYPESEFRIENPLRPCAETAWTGTRHRMDVLYGRDFNAANMSPATLDAIDDLFGPIHLDTVAQSIHFARFSAITNQRGRGEFVTRRRLRERWGNIPTLAIHGADNGLVDVYTQSLLQAHFQAAEIPFEARTFGDFGHQDLLIGTGSAAVFETIAGFHGEAATAGTAQAMRWVPDLPWIGPRIDFDGDSVWLACMSAPDQGRARLILIAVQASVDAGAPKRTFIVHDWADCVDTSVLRSSNDWIFARVPVRELRRRVQDQQHFGWLALIVFDIDDTTAVLGRSPTEPSWPLPLQPVHAGAESALPSPGDGSSGPPAGEFPRLPDPEWLRTKVSFPTGAMSEALLKLGAVPSAALTAGAGLPPGAAEAIEWARKVPAAKLEAAFVRLADLEKAEHSFLAEAPEPRLRFTLASCQYPAGLFDRRMAEASLRTMAESRRAEAASFDLALFVGDQVYADATAGVADPTRSDERYDQPNERALRAKPLREVMRHVPAFTLLDDHEIEDNSEPAPAAAARRRPADDEASERRLRLGFAAWSKYQLMRKKSLPRRRTHEPTVDPCRPDPPPTKRGSYHIRFAGYPFYFADTRTGRSARCTANRGDWEILNAAQIEDLKTWLADRPDKLKFVVTPSLLLPRRTTTADDRWGSFRSDSWDGYPATLCGLLQWMALKQIRKTVFLSGDEHHSLYSTIDLRPHSTGLAPVHVVSIHSSALYAPFPFANGRPSDLVWQNDSVTTCEQVSIDVSTTLAPAGDGYARIEVEPTGAGHTLKIWFVKNTGLRDGSFHTLHVP